MNLIIRRLGSGDEAVLELLARDDSDFDLSERSTPRQPLSRDTARRYLENPTVLHWVASHEATVVGFLTCHVLPLRSNQGQELLLYEIGVRSSWRRHGVGRALLAHMEDWMCNQQIREAWVLADNPIAVEFYRACGFAAETSQPAYMTRKLN